MSPTRLRGRGADEGFTLVELILAIIIIGVITVPLGNIVIGYLKNVDATTSRLIESHDVQIASAYWAQDVASIGRRSATYQPTQSVETNVYDSSQFPCGDPRTTPTVTLAWDDFSGPDAPTHVVVAYLVQTKDGEQQLHRLRCKGSEDVVDVILAHKLDPAKPPAVACWTAGGVSTPCAAAPDVLKTVTLTLTLKDASNRDAAYEVTLTGQRRQS